MLSLQGGAKSIVYFAHCGPRPTDPAGHVYFDFESIGPNRPTCRSAAKQNWVNIGSERPDLPTLRAEKKGGSERPDQPTSDPLARAKREKNSDGSYTLQSQEPLLCTCSEDGLITIYIDAETCGQDKKTTIKARSHAHAHAHARAHTRTHTRTMVVGMN